MGDEKKRPISFLHLDIQGSSIRDKPTLSEQHSIDCDDVWSTDLTNLDLERGKGNATPIFLEWEPDGSNPPSNAERRGNTILVEWTPNDPEKPSNWSRTKKWVITVTVCCLAVVALSGTGTVAIGYPSMTADFQSSDEENALTLSTYALGYGVTPLLLSAFSEEYGRRPVYIVASIIFTLFYLPIGLATNIQTVIVARLIQGSAGSTGATMVGGTIADIWDTHERGIAMCMLAFVPLFCTGGGRVVMGWVEQGLGWRWIGWTGMFASGALTVWLVVYGAQETRGSILLARRAERLRKETGDSRYHVASNPLSTKQLIWISCTRPMSLLLTEPIVTCFSLWLAFVWGVLFCLLQSMGLVFHALYDFNQVGVGLVSLTICAGSVIGLCTNFYQESLYRKHVTRVGAEARLCYACSAGITFAIGSLIYAWTSYKYIHWIAPCIGITIIIASTFTIYLAGFNYLADTYSIYASSALAGQSLLRSVAGTAFPLFTDQLYKKMGFNWAGTLIGLVGAALAPIPIVLYFYGPQIRARSRVAGKLAAAAEQAR